MESEERTSGPATEPPAGTCLSELPREPSPVPCCPACLSHSVARENARSGGDYSAVSDANVRMRQHQRDEHAGNQP
ncbi:hypothetical protein B1H20_12405 [Streptomyces violaceoruber]|uniref:Uncharacterized protein n=1 Tax=Streptomyces violaceoruber TaxID=1935 RepID=A0A1V0UA43_STRVN|nr:hypothetical protein B1H20_12405 [Streptomyces violaceoruber]